MPKPNPKRERRQKTADSPPPRDQGKRDAPVDTTDWVELAHEEAEAQRRLGDVIPASRGNAPGGTKPKPPRA